MTRRLWKNNVKITAMIKFQPTFEHALYALALAVAVGLRFLHLGALPLSDYEADWALQALRITQGLKPAIGPNPAYVHLTALLFYIFGATNFLARFWPALAGSVMILATWSLRARIGRIAALVLAFGLAIDPGLVAMSHLAGGPMLALAFLALAVLMWMNGRRAAAGLLGGLALLSGPSVWFGMTGAALAWALASGFRNKTPVPTEENDFHEEALSKSSRPRPEELRGVLFWGLGTLIIAGSLFFLSPKGLPAVIASLGTFLRGWWILSDVRLWQILFSSRLTRSCLLYSALPRLCGVF